MSLPRSVDIALGKSMQRAKVWIRECREMTDEILSGAWNVLQWAGRLGNDQTERARFVAREMRKRGIPHEVGKRTVIRKNTTSAKSR